MTRLTLPHSLGCLVCGRDNPIGLRLTLAVDASTGDVFTLFTPAEQHIGFAGVIHGGVLATVVDEAMVWAATWAGKQFCLAGEMTVRFRKSASPGVPLHVVTKIESTRGKLISTSAEMRTADGALICTASGKYVQVSLDEHRKMLATLIVEPETMKTFEQLSPASLEPCAPAS